MELETQLLHQINDAALTCSERILLRCEYAKRLEEAGNYDAAQAMIGDFWQQIGERPQTEGLDERAAAELLLRVGVLSAWIGSTRQIEGAQERAKNLISESMTLYEALQEPEKATEGRIELAICYWREGAIDEARVMLQDALERLAETASELKAIALVRSALIEQIAFRHSDALRLLTEAKPFVEASTSEALKGKFHNELATTLKNLGAAEHREDYTDRALVEYAAASFHFEQAGHSRYRACVENNLGSLYSMVGRFIQAHEHLNHARRLLVNLKDSIHVAQVDETRARVLLAEGRNVEAERIARMAVEVLEKGGEHQLLAEALTTHGTTLARLGRHQQARLTLQNAIVIADQAGDTEGAGQAILTAIEELNEQLLARELGSLYDRAVELLSTSQLPSISRRLNECARLVVRIVSRELVPDRESERAGDFRAAAGWHNFHFWTEVERYETYLIERALKEAKGVVTRAARLLGFTHHESLNSMLKGRHRNLLPLRTPIEPRRQSILRDGQRESRQQHRRAIKARPVKILHVEDDPHVADAVKETLEGSGWAVETCASGTAAMRVLSGGSSYDLLIFDYELKPGPNGLELLRHARQLPHRRRVPVIMLSGSDVEAEAWRAGVDAFLRKPEDVDRLTATVTRLLPERK